MFTVRKVFGGETLIFTGELVPCIFLVKSGQLKATKRITDADRLLGMINPGEFIGEMAYLSGQNNTAICDVTAAVDSELIEIPKENFYEVLAKNPVWLKALVKSLVARIEALNKKV